MDDGACNSHGPHSIRQERNIQDHSRYLGANIYDYEYQIGVTVKGPHDFVQPQIPACTILRVNNNWNPHGNGLSLQHGEPPNACMNGCPAELSSY